MIWLFRCVSSPTTSEPWRRATEAPDLRTRLGNSSLTAPSIFANLCPVNQLIGIGDADSGKVVCASRAIRQMPGQAINSVAGSRRRRSGIGVR